MEKKLIISIKEKKVSYQKPLFEKQDKMAFPIAIMEKFNQGRLCLQCSGCHGCR